jgi:hypothetical protein
MRVTRLSAPLFYVLSGALGACSRGSKRVAPVAQPGEVGTLALDSAPRSATTPAVFSVPIGAIRIAGVDVVAGLVAADGVVRCMGLVDGAVSWTADVLKGAAWAPDAELRLQPAADGFALVWRGLLGGKPARTLVVCGPHGERLGDPTEIGVGLCSVADGVAWIGPREEGGPTRVRARRWGEGQSHDVITVPRDRDPSLVCGDQDVLVLADGDDDLTAARVAPGEVAAPRPIVVLRDSDFPDEEREHDLYSNVDDLGLVRVGASGAVAIREVPRTGSPGPWRRLKLGMAEDDDVVAVDGDAAATFVVITHEADSACPEAGATAETVRALRLDRRTGAESLLDLAPADCANARGPFWVASSRQGTVVAWTERRTGASPRAAPVTGLSFRALRADGVQSGHIDAAADALVDGGCRDGRCSVAVLERAPGSDGTQPEPIRVYAYP